jgi:dTDP-4-amino-4,6-dideoxygalactose transaminase
MPHKPGEIGAGIPQADIHQNVSSTSAKTGPGETIPVLRPKLPRADRLLPYLERIDATRIYSNHGPLSLELECRLCEHFRLPPGAVVLASSGTTALIGAILASADRPDSERAFAMVPAFTFIATAAAVEQCGYRVFLVDIDSDTWMLDAQRLAKHPALDKVGLVVPVAPFGRPVPQEPWRVFSEQTGIPVVIDGAASFVDISETPERFLGPIPVALSFHATKCFATGEGGAVASNDVDLTMRVTRALNFGIHGIRDCQSPSTNGKMSEYHAAVGLAEFDLWPDKRNAYRAVADSYRQRMADVGLADRLYTAPDVAPSYTLLRCTNARESNAVKEALHKGGIDFRLWYGAGLHTQTFYSDLPRDVLTVTDDLAPHTLGLPVATDLHETTIARIVATVAEAFGDLP